LLIHSFADIASHFPEHILQIYGDGPLRQQLEEQILSCGMANRIFLCGHSDHIYDDIRNAALFVSSSDYEGISNSMLEAIALGVPTICTDCPAGGAREMICNRENGLLVPVADRAALAEAMLQVLNNERLASKMSQAGTQLRQTLCVAEIAKEWLAFIDRVIA
jgi:glycosyltransferase involved in cell wall biosynthesis